MPLPLEYERSVWLRGDILPQLLQTLGQAEAPGHERESRGGQAILLDEAETGNVADEL